MQAVIPLVLGDYGKLGHGNSTIQKYPKLIVGVLSDKVGLVFSFMLLTQTTVLS